MKVFFKKTNYFSVSTYIIFLEGDIKQAKFLMFSKNKDIILEDIT